MTFISYSHDSDEFCDQLLAISNTLRKRGVDCNIDQYEESPPEGWPRWMERQIREAEFVLVVCSKHYEEKATLRSHPGVGLGVKWESNLILNQLYSTDSVTTKFIPVIIYDDDVSSILDPLKGQTHYNLSHDDQLEKLKNRLLGISNTNKPPVGEIRPQETRPAKLDARFLVTGVIDVDVWNKADWKGVGYIFDFASPPCIGIYHKNTDAGIKIFADWVNRFGHDDRNDEIYISIIEDDDSNAYTIHIGADIEAVDTRLKKSGMTDGNVFYMQHDRWHRMVLVDRHYLDAFKAEYSRFGYFFLVPMKSVNGQPVLVQDLSIKKRKIRLRKISEVTDKSTDYDYLALELKAET